jgi:ubiquinone/menaquinone biosynthesis C-methylase UbiE
MKSKQKLKDLHNANYAHEFEKLSVQNHYKIYRLLKLCKLNKTDIVADFACGSGMLMPLISPQVKKYYGVDFSESFILAAEQKKHDLNINNAEFFNSEINEFCALHINEFDAAFAMDFSEHVYDQ